MKQLHQQPFHLMEREGGSRARSLCLPTFFALHHGMFQRACSRVRERVAVVLSVGGSRARGGGAIQNLVKWGRKPLILADEK